MEAEMIAKLAAFETEVREMNRRLESLEKLTQSVHDVATSVQLLAQRQSAMEGQVSTIAEDVGELKDKPAKRWEAVVACVISGLGGAFITYLVSKIIH